jgi:hypothetical protein
MAPNTPTILWGSLGPDSSKIDTALETAVGKTQSLPHLALPWAYGRQTDGTPNYAAFPAAMLQPVYARGSLALLDWASWDLTNKPDPAFALDTVIAGQHDAFVHAWAAAAAAFGNPILLRFDWEFNGDWFPFGAQPAKFVAAWRKLRGIFAAEGASNVAWLWCANVGAPAGSKWPTATDKLMTYYPGDDQVDWTGFDTYNWSSRNGGPWMTFDQIMNGYSGWFGPTYDALAKLAPTKPMCVAEFGCWDDPRKPLWMVDALSRVPTAYPLVRAIEYFNWNEGTGSLWPLTGDAVKAFAGVLASPVYLAAGDWVPNAGQPLPAPTRTLTLASALPAEYQQNGWTSWEQAAANLAARAAQAARAVDELNGKLIEATTRATTAESSLNAVRNSLQILQQVGSATA